MQKPLPLPQFPPNPSCTLCPLHKCARSVGIPTHIIPSSLPLSPSHPCVLFLGQNPGHTEDVFGTPFIGPSGQVLQNAYIDGIQLRTLASIFVSNTARCYHLQGDGPTNAHYKACRPHLLPDLHYLASHSSSLTVVTLGAPATTHLHALLGIPKVTLSSALTHQGRSIPLSPDSSQSLGDLGPRTITVFSTFHPAACLRERKLIHAVEGHLTLVLNHLTGRTPVPSLPSFITPIPPPKDLP